MLSLITQCTICGIMSFISARTNECKFFYGKNLYGQLGWRGLPNQAFLGARISIGDQDKLNDHHIINPCNLGYPQNGLCWEAYPDFSYQTIEKRLRHIGYSTLVVEKGYAEEACKLRLERIQMNYLHKQWIYVQLNSFYIGRRGQWAGDREAASVSWQKRARGLGTYRICTRSGPRSSFSSQSRKDGVLSLFSYMLYVHYYPT